MSRAERKKRGGKTKYERRREETITMWEKLVSVFTLLLGNGRYR